MSRFPSVGTIAVVGSVLVALLTVRPILATVGAHLMMVWLLVEAVRAPGTATESTSTLPGTSGQR